MAISTNMIKFRDGPFDDPYLSEKEIRKIKEEYDRREYERRMMMSTPIIEVRRTLGDLKEEKMPACEFKPVNRILLLCEV
jgi:hypothetical protein